MLWCYYYLLIYDHIMSCVGLSKSCVWFIISYVGHTFICERLAVMPYRMFGHFLFVTASCEGE